jgi:hypothetical protein
MRDDETPRGRGNRERWAEVVNKTCKCRFCPPHGIENRGRRPRSDKHKTRRKVRHA